jgi:hypothetical protein
MNSTIPVPPPVFEVCMPLPNCAASFMQALHEACPSVHISVVEATEHGMLINIGGIFIFCARHCPNPAHSCIMVSIGTTIVPYDDEETTPQYIQRVVALIVKLLNQQALIMLCELLPAPQTLYVVIEKDKIQLMVGDFTPDSTTATIEGGSLIHCDIPLKTNVLPNPALMAQFLNLIELSSAGTVYVRIQATRNGFASLHNNGERFIFLSYNQGISTKLDVRDLRLIEVETFLKRPTDDLVVIFTSGTPFSGVVGRREFFCENYANTIPTGQQWVYLKNIL